MQTTQIPASTLAVYVLFEVLPQHLPRFYVTRRGSRTYIYADPSLSLHEAMCWSMDNLSPDERNYLRGVIAQPPIGQCLDPDLMDLPVGVVFDRPELRLPMRRPARLRVDRNSSAAPS